MRLNTVISLLIFLNQEVKFVLKKILSLQVIISLFFYLLSFFHSTSMSQEVKFVLKKILSGNYISLFLSLFFLSFHAPYTVISLLIFQNQGVKFVLKKIPPGNFYLSYSFFHSTSMSQEVKFVLKKILTTGKFFLSFSISFLSFTPLLCPKR
jgi:hypothetical protein